MMLGSSLKKSRAPAVFECRVVETSPRSADGVTGGGCPFVFGFSGAVKPQQTKHDRHAP